MNKQSCSTIKIFKRLFYLISNILILLISFIVPKTDKIIIVGGWFGKRFADNSKHFFLYVNENKKQLAVHKIVWITRSDTIKVELRSRGYDAYKAWSVQSIWYHLRAKNHIIDQSIIDINPFFSVRSKRINLWHGFPLKRIGTFTKDTHRKRTLRSNQLTEWLSKISIRGFWGDHYVLATSEFSAKILGDAFNVTSNRIIISCYPRNYEPIVSKPIKYVPKNEKNYLNLIERAKEQGNAIIGYFPTFRDKKETLIFGTKDRNELGELLDYFKKSNIKVVCKFHFAGKDDKFGDIYNHVAGKDDKFGDIYNHEAFLNLPSDADVYTFLSKVDILITDYSSIYFDYLLWERPIIFFPYDLEYYRDEDRGLIFDYYEFTPGPKVFNAKELEEVLSKGINDFRRSYASNYSEVARNLKIKIFGNPEKMKIDHLLRQIRSLIE